MKLDKPQLWDTFEVFSEFARIHLIYIRSNLEGTLGDQQNSRSYLRVDVSQSQNMKMISVSLSAVQCQRQS